MKLFVPIFQLKRQAKALTKGRVIKLHDALDQIAAREGYASWSLLAAQYAKSAPLSKLYSNLTPGNLLLIGARPGQGKTLLGLKLAIEAMKQGKPSTFFSLEYTERDLNKRFTAIGVARSDFNDLFEFENSDAINADLIVSRLDTAPPGSIAIVDYLQLLDQKRDNPELDTQIRLLQGFARKKSLILAFISQIDRSYDPERKPLPDIEDIRLPNALDLSLFDKTCFLHNGQMQFKTAA